MTEPNARKPRRKFTDEFRADAVRLATSSQTTIAQTARDLGIGDTLLRVWIAAARAPEKTLTPDERTELATLRHEARLKFWETLLPYAATRSELHANISPGKYHWVGARKLGHWWNYIVLMDEVRVEFYIDVATAAENKAVFDAIHAQREGIERAYGAPLFWQRLDDKRASRISVSVAGGWADESTWTAATEQAVAAMQRLYAALAPAVRELREG